MTAYKKHTIFSASLLAAVVAFPLTGFAQTDNQLQNRIRQLENQVQTMSRAVYRGETPPASQQAPAYSGNSASSLAANTEIRLSDIEDQLRKATGKMEQLEYDNHRLQQRVEQLEKQLQNQHNSAPVTSYTYQPQPGYAQGATPSYSLDPMPAQTGPTAPQVVNTLPAGTKPLGTMSIPQNAGAAPSAVPSSHMTAVADTPEKAYESAYAKIREAKYKEAATSFAGFISAYPNHKLSANAQYWLAETYYVRGKFSEAAKLFAKGYQNYPKSSKTADNLLKLGLSLAQSGKKDDACLTYTQLQKEFPNKKGIIMQRSMEEQKRLGCGS